MSVRTLALFVPILLGGAWFGGIFGGSVYSREVDRTPEQVASALMDLDVREQPGEPGTDPSRSGGVTPVFRTERTPDGISFVVMSGDQVATRMVAQLEPLDEGRRTRATARVERGDAPDDFVSPAFRSTGITLGLFTMALEGELDELVAPPRRSAAECRELAERLLLANAPVDAVEEPEGLKQAVGNTAQVVMRLHAVEAELRRRGCPTNGRGAGGRFPEISDQMSGGGVGTAPTPARTDQTNFEPGRPMVDVSR